MKRPTSSHNILYEQKKEIYIMLGAVNQSYGVYQSPPNSREGDNLLSMSANSRQYSLESWEKILGQGVNPNISDNRGMTPLIHVISKKYSVGVQELAPIIEVLIRNGADCNQATKAGETALGLLLFKEWDDFPQLRELAFDQIKNKEVEPNSLEYCNKPLFLFMSKNLTKYSSMAFKTLLDRGLDSNISDNLGMTPLIHVITHVISQEISVGVEVRAPIIEVLIRNGADCNQATKAGETALGLLLFKEWDDFPQLRELAFDQIKNKEVEPNSLEYSNKPLFLFMSKNLTIYSSMAFKTLLDRGLDSNISDNLGMTPLIHVITHVISQEISVGVEVRAPIIEVLIRNGASCNQATKAGVTALGLLLFKEWDDFPQLRELAFDQIKNKEVEPNSLEYCNKPLFLFMSKNLTIYSSMAFKTLLDRGLDSNISDNLGMTPLIHVITHVISQEISVGVEVRAPIIEVLIRNGANCNQATKAGETALGLLLFKKWDDFPQLRELAFEQIKNKGVEPNSLKYCKQPLFSFMSRNPILYSKLVLRTILRQGVLPKLLPKLNEKELEQTVGTQSTVTSDFVDELEKHKAHYYCRPLEYRCICAVSHYSKNQELTMLPVGIQRNIKSLFFS